MNICEDAPAALPGRELQEAGSVLTFKWVTFCHAIGCRHMINRTGIFDAQLSGHGKNPTASPGSCKYTGLAPLQHRSLIVLFARLIADSMASSMEVVEVPVSSMSL